MSVLERPVVPEPATVRTASNGAPDLLRIGTFFALALFASLHWANLVASPPAGRVLAAVVAATAAGALMVALRRTPRPLAFLGALILTAVVAALSLTALGLQAKLLWPTNWNDLGAQLDRGMSGIRTVTWPYAGPESVVRLVILLGIAPLLTLAAALTFWPAKGRRAAAVLRALGLITLLCLYGVPVTDHDPGSPVVRGFVLLILVAAWLWLPRLKRREAVPAAVLVAIAALVAIPVSAQLNRDASLVDYSQWNWFGGKEVTFDWNHSYGPLDWPREGTTMLEIRSRQPLYWKAEVLDRFDGLRWNRSDTNDRTSPLAEVPPDPDTRWDRSVRVNVRSLRTDFVVGTGTPYRVTGAGQAITGSADGTLRRLSQPLERGDEYTVQTYAPTPNASELRTAPRSYDSDLSQYTAVSLPATGDSALRRTERDRFATRPTVQVPLTSSGGGEDPGVAQLFAGSPYARTYRLARRLTSGQPTVYDSVRRVRDYLQQGYRYSERPPVSRYPLESFLFKDKIGYCQQFSGAMALMLRMSGIPARVATGFSPGSYDRESGTYRVRDLDAHSWVEVYFAGTGWVTFDPTPPAAPADRAGNAPQAPGSDGGRDAAGALSNDDRDSGNATDPLGNTPESSGGDRSAASGGNGSSSLPTVAVAGGGVVAVVLLAGGVVLLRRRRPRSAEQRLDELQRALPRLGWTLPGGITLLELERRLGKDAGPASAAYVAGLRRRRFASSSKPEGENPGLDRSALRRELSANGGVVRRLRGFLALPPTRRGA